MPISQSLPPDVIFSTLYSVLALTDSILQIWLTLTFAVIVSTYVAVKRFDRSVYLLITFLYSFASAIQLMRFVSAAHQAFYYKNLLDARGFGPWPVPNVVSVLIGGGSIALIIIGTLSTLWFVRATWKNVTASRQGPSPEP